MKKAFTLLLAVFVHLNLKAQNTDFPITLNTSSQNQMNITDNGGGAYTINTLGTDPYVYGNNISTSYNSDEVYYFSFDYIASAGIDDVEIFFGPPITAAQSIQAGALPATSVFKTFTINMKDPTTKWTKAFSQFRFDIGRKTGQQIIIKNIVLRKPTATELANDPYASSRLFDSYLNTNFSNKVSNVAVDSLKVNVDLQIPSNPGTLYLCELKMYDDILKPENISFATPITATTEIVHLDFDRYLTIGADRYDRLLSRWVIAEKTGNTYVYKSYAHYANDIFKTANGYLPEEKPLTKKGIGGFTTSGGGTADLSDVGYNNVTINMVLTSFITLSSTTTSFVYNGKTYYYNTSAVTNLDNTLKTCSDNNALVSMILLIPRGITGSLGPILNYPDADNGPYTMANVTSLQGINYYAAFIAFLSQRYSRTDKLYGRINSWILHNEVDYGYYWTNAGSKPVNIYTEIYDRSMRTVYYAARMYNPAAKVFLSLDHFWANVGAAGSYPSITMLNQFKQMSAKQGDYEWGVAYHPYPASLLEPKTWNDGSVTLDVNSSPLVTPKNAELIDTWMRQKTTLYQGQKVRTLMFSEQGIQTKRANGTFTTQALKEQAAGVAYMWKKFNRLPTLEAFQYHRRVDNRQEGGLWLGLWTTQTGQDEAQDVKKPSWYVIQAAGTANEDNVFAPYLSTVGVSSWDKTFNPLVGEVMPQKVVLGLKYQSAALIDAEIFFDAEMHKTDATGTATFFNVATNVNNRSYKVMKDGQLIWSAVAVNVTGALDLSTDLDAVKNLKTEAVNATTVKLTWDDNADFEKGFVIQSKIENEGDFKTIFTTTANATSYSDASILAGKKYVYRLYAYNDSVKTLYSKEAMYDNTLTTAVANDKENQTAKVMVYPNPSNGIINLQISDLSVRNLSVRLYDSNGKIIYSENIKAKSGQNSYQLKLVQKPNPGVYILRVNADKLQEALKVVIQ
nr:DUF5722 domain-containing protein [uncultured Pedobacter sp.]